VKASVSIKPAPEWGPGQAHVEVNGHDISTALRGLSLELSVGNLPKVELDLCVVDVTDFAMTEVQLHIPDDVRDALVKLGWTPPPEDT